MRVGVLCSRIRVEEKLLLEALWHLGAEAEQIEVSALALSPPSGLEDYDAVLVRCISHFQSLYASKLLDQSSLRVINRPDVIATCGDLLVLSSALSGHGVPIPHTRFAFSQRAALDAIEEMGYPVMLRPLNDYNGELSAQVRDRDGAETLLEHKQMLGGDRHSIFCVQEPLAQAVRSIRAYVVGDSLLGVTNTQLQSGQEDEGRSSQTDGRAISPELEEIALQAATAVGGGVLAVDLVQEANGQLWVVGADHAPEFRSSTEPSPSEIARRIAEHVLEISS